MSVTVILPQVSACDATRCSYNSGRRCHAPAITVGDTTHPICDTFLPDSRHVAPRAVAGVGACKVELCAYNRDRTCSAPSIDISLHGEEPDCATFKRRAT